MSMGKGDMAKDMFMYTQGQYCSDNFHSKSRISISKNNLLYYV